MQTSEKDTISSTPFDITVRKDLNWDFSEIRLDNVLGDNPLISLFWISLSIGAPLFESAFIKTMLPITKKIDDDEKFVRDIKDMISQEAQHAHNHNILNKHLESIGMDCKGINQRVEKIVASMLENMAPLDALGLVTAGEYSLATIADVWLNNNNIRKSVHPQIRRLYDYHFLEEAEHGAVSHDMYKYFTKSYLHRVGSASRAMPLVFALLKSIRHCSDSIGYKITLKDRLKYYYYSWINPGLLRKYILKFIKYFSPRYKLEYTHLDMELMKRIDRELYQCQHESR